MTPPEQNRLIDVQIDAESLISSGPQAERERQIAIADLLEENMFALIGRDAGLWRLNLSRLDNRLVFNITDADNNLGLALHLSLSPFRKIIKDYWRICESYYEAIEVESRAHIETIDMARKAIHDEGSELLHQRLAERIKIDDTTARRLFTLVCALHKPGLGR